MNPRKLWLPVLIALAAQALVPTRVSAQPKAITACTTIGAAGSYVLTANLTATSTTLPCISVSVAGVTLDLHGFVLTGIGGSSGISASAGPLTITNGFIRSFSVGISAAVPRIKLGQVTLLSNKGDGAVLGDDAEVRDSKFLNNGADGLDVGSNGLITHCIFVGNKGDGAKAGGTSAVVVENVANSNGDPPGASANSGAAADAIDQKHPNDHGHRGHHRRMQKGGFVTTGNATVIGNAAIANTAWGFKDPAGGTTFEGNSGGASTATSSFGFLLMTTGSSAGSTFIGNSAQGNGGDGFSIQGGSTFEANTADGNGNDGFLVGAGATFTTNTADSNGTFGFSVLCPNNLIGNTAEDNAVGQFTNNGQSGCAELINLGF